MADKKTITTNKRDLAVKLLLESFAKGNPITLVDAMRGAKYSEKTALAKCHGLKEHPLYKKYQANQTKNAFSSKDAIEKKLHTWLEADLIDFYDALEYERSGKLVIKDLETLTKEQRTCIESIRPNRYGLEIKLVSKEKALDMLCKINGLFIAKVEHSGAGGGPIEHFLGSDNLKPEVVKGLNEPNNRIKDYTNQN